MDRSRVWGRAPLAVMCVGAVLFLSALLQHTRELLVLGEITGPLLALLVDGTPALALTYGGYRLSRTDLPPRGSWTVLVWSLSGVVLFVAAMGATFVVRIAEGRTVAEPTFPLLVAANAGGIAGLIAGYYNARAREDARRSRTVNNALAFINELIRHDLRNDLNVIRGHADLIADADPGVVPDAADADTVAEKSDEALSRIETSRIIADTLVGDPELEPTDLVPVVTEMGTRTNDAFDATIETDLPDGAMVTANAGIRSVVDNLLENAVEHNDADDPRVDVAVTIEGDTVRLTVTDNGPGIPDDLKESLFEPDGEGSGGGLSLVYTLVTGYGGDVRVADADPRGSRFVVDLPRAESGSAAGT